MPAARKPPKKAWTEVASDAQGHRDTTIAALSPSAPKVPSTLPKNVLHLPEILLDQSVLSITALMPEELLRSLSTGQISAVQVTTAYLHRAAVAQGLSNCLTELLPSLSLDRARELDAYYEEHQCPIGPLHGLPISLKEHLGLQGLRCTTGYISHWDNIAKEDAHIIQVLRDAGAVFHCRTTVPQTMMHLETDSNLYGVTTNPYNSNLTSGGSSGGEGALIALGGSCIGIGSDVGGSIRCPAANCGVYGLKPTAFRLPTDGWGYMMAAADSVETVLGPLSTSLQGLKICMKTIIDSEPWLVEPALIPMPWRSYSVPTDRPLRIGVLWHDGIVRPHPPITRALKLVVDKLKAHKVEVIDFAPYLHDEAWAILASLYYPDGGEADSEDIASSGEPWRPLSQWIIKDNPCVKKLSIGELTYWSEEREAYRKEYASHWNNLHVDALLCPVGPGVAPKHNTARYWSYTSQWNLLDYPGLVFPVCTVDKEQDKWTGDEPPLGELDKDNRELWDPEEFHGAPVGLQLVGRRFEDEKIVGILEHITGLIGLPLKMHF
ncbi:amidase signature domain-containing protein [Boeremia exigua]|uniref:amidase signature domain-containing protein n=1 Tax=Boeremia exigua TaxID=749465 RepID=UPI001E8E59FB|nr:amidase signature domain-containing protein [Boeremia exigua]KAH6622086.1 amidase signature domain-containing protein [Boeremia exigua]